MCTTDQYTYVYPDGHKETVNRPALCPSSRHGQPCSQNLVFKHGTMSVSYSHPASPALMTSAAYSPSYYGTYPPTPTYSSTYRSGDESDRSYHSTSRSSSRRRSVYMAPRIESGLHRHGQGGRTVLVHNPPTPSTPPAAFTFPRTAPSSPSFANAAPFITDTFHRGTSSRRPMIVDERPRHSRDTSRIHIEFHDSGRKKEHRRQTSSTSSHGSRHSYQNASEDDDMRRRRREAEDFVNETRRLAQEEEIRQQRLYDRIARANAEIARREPVPVPSTLRRSSTAAKATYHAEDREEELLDRIQRLEIEEQARHDRGRSTRRDEEHAQKERLMQRMLPRRRATVGPGSRRPRVEYSDGVYRWE